MKFGKFCVQYSRINLKANTPSIFGVKIFNSFPTNITSGVSLVALIRLYEVLIYYSLVNLTFIIELINIKCTFSINKLTFLKFRKFGV